MSALLVRCSIGVTLVKDTWKKTVESIMKRDLLDDLSEDLVVSHPTAFNMRYNVLHVLKMEFAPWYKECGDADITMLSSLVQKRVIHLR